MWVGLLKVSTKATQLKGFKNPTSSFSSKLGTTNWDRSPGYFILRPDILLPRVAFSFIHPSMSVCALISSFCWDYQCVSHMSKCCYQNSDEDNLKNKRLILYHSSRAQGTTCVLLKLRYDWNLGRELVRYQMQSIQQQRKINADSFLLFIQLYPSQWNAAPTLEWVFPPQLSNSLYFFNNKSKDSTFCKGDNQY